MLLIICQKMRKRWQMIGLLSINHSVKTKDKKTPGRRGEWTESSGHFYRRLRAVQGIRGLSYTGGYGRFRGEWVKPLYCPCFKASTCEKHHGYHARSYMAFKFSAKHLLVFKEQLGDNPFAREEMGRRSKLKLLCETRWAPRADCLSVFVDAFKV